jgi:hypothetical protein
VLNIVDTLRRNRAVARVEVIDFVDEASVKYLKCRADLLDGSKLYIIESSFAANSKYSYHWQDSNNQLIVRWDNAPHHAHLSTFPHHRHEPDQIRSSPRVAIDEVLAEIEARLKRDGLLP